MTVKNATNTVPAFERQKGKGRPKGAVNKTTTTAKEAIALAAEGLGGTPRLIAWAREDAKNEHAFWASIYPRLIPLDVNATIAVSMEARKWLGQA